MTIVSAVYRRPNPPPFAEARLTVTGDQEDFTPMADVYRAYTDWAFREGLGRNEVRSQTDLGHGP